MKRQEVVEGSLLLAIVIFAAALRLWNLPLLPYGFHGDEAVSGLEAQRIWRENGIGPYTSAALGQPTGPIYLVALSLRFFGDSIFAVRLVSALSGVLTIVVLYWGARRHFGWKVAALAAFLLTIANWHLHYSRIGFPLAMWPLVVLLGTFILLEAIERQHLVWWALAGVVLCSGIYIYNAHGLFLVIACLFTFWCLAENKDLSRQTRAAFTGVFGFAVLLTVAPMMLYALQPEHHFFSHFQLYSLLAQPEWKNAPSYSLRLGLIVGRYLDFWERLCWNPRWDVSDGSGIVTLVPLALVLLAIAGAYCAWKKRRDKAMLFFVLLLIFLPCAAVFTVDGSLRRTFALSPFLVVLAAFGSAQIYGGITEKKPRLRNLAVVTAVCLLVGMTTQTVRDYFVRFPRTEHQSWSFLTAITEASHWMNRLPPDTHIYFFSERWSAQYQTRQFLAPRVWIDDFSKEHGTYTLDNDDRDRESVWMLLDKYQSSLDEIRALHPGGEIIYGPPLPGTEQICFVAYHLKKHRSNKHRRVE